MIFTHIELALVMIVSYGIGAVAGYFIGRSSEPKEK